MPRKVRDSRLESRTARLRLPIRKKPYTGPSLARGVMLLFRRNKGNGRWVVKAADGHGAYWTKGFAEADDLENADGIHVLTFHQACDVAKALARGQTGTPGDKPLTVADAIAAYKRDLKSRGKHLTSATRVEYHLTGVLAGKPVGLLTVRDLQTWRDGLIEKMQPSSVNRTRTGLRAALELVATLDHRISNRHVFRLQTPRLAGIEQGPAHRTPGCRCAAHHKGGLRDQPCLWSTGRGASSDRRAAIASGTADVRRSSSRSTNPRLMMPSSFKGRGQKKFTHRPVPITSTLAAALKNAKGDRPNHEPLLLKQDGRAWQATSTCDHRDLFHRAVERAELNPNEVTSYSLRHSSIVRALLRGVPVAVVAQQHDTSVREIEAHYAAYILDHSRRCLAAGTAGNSGPAEC